MLKRKFDNLLSRGKGRQLLWLFLVCVALILLAVCITRFVFRDGKLVWQDVVAIFLSAGAFRGAGVHDVFRLLLALTGVFLFSALLVSVVKNIFDNISESVKKGTRYYRLENHVLILGSGRHLRQMLRELSQAEQKQDVLVMTAQDVEKLRTSLLMEFSDKAFTDRIIFYAGELENREVLKQAHPEQAECIYIIGEDGEQDHDSRCMSCLGVVEKLCQGAERKIPCYVMLESSTSQDIINYSQPGAPAGSPLQTELVNLDEYMAECLLRKVENGVPFLPTLKKEDERTLHLLIAGKSSMAQAMATMAGHICHFPDFKEFGRRVTKVTFLSSKGKLELEDEFMAKFKRIMRLNGLMLDVSWEYMDQDLDHEELQYQLLNMLSQDVIFRVVMCQDTLEERLKDLTRLPRKLLEHPDFACAVYMDRDSWFVRQAQRSGMYGKIFTFGPADENADPLFLRRFQQAKRVNHVYATQGNISTGDIEKEWNALSWTYKLSSVYSAMGYELRKRCFSPEDKEGMYEAEHRRWIVSELLMGYTPLTREEDMELEKLRSNPDEFKKKAEELKRKFHHPLLKYFQELSPEDQQKDQILMEHVDYIIGENN